MQNKYLVLTVVLLFGTFSAMAHLPKKITKKTKARVENRAFCANSESAIDQEINNVRARLLGGGDCWWDLTNGRYVVPKVDATSGQEEVSSIFAAAVWIGGFDDNGNLKLACQDYRESGLNDFWPGPLDEETGKTDADQCKNWDTHFRVTSDDIRQHLANLAAGNLNINDVPKSIRGWPARGNPYFVDVHGFSLPARTEQGLAGFFDADFSMDYDPLKGDYPSIEIRKCEPYSRYPDEMIFWIYNDEGAGNTHGQTSGKPIQMEVQVQAFGYQTSDALNDMTFQRYKLINRASEPIDSTFFAMWVDPDLGCHLDDYIGCDTLNELMYVYNQDETDGQPNCNCPSPSGEVPTYCENIPMLGVDYFRGPTHWVTKVDAQGNEEQVLEEIGMSAFMYYNNGGVPGTHPATGDPELPFEFYNYLNSRWKDGTRLTKGGNGYNPGSTDYTLYAFPSSPNDPAGWSMCSEDLFPGDRRTVQASGPFRLMPGATNELIIGVPWIADVNMRCPDVELILRADKLAQGLFDNCFERLEGPDAPTVDWIELNQQLIAVLSNNAISNNKNEGYVQADFLAPNRFLVSTDPAVRDSALFKFEGYKVYQLINPNVSTKDFTDPDKSRLVVQVDRRNNVKRIFNWEETTDPDEPDDPTKKVFYPVEKVNGANEGLKHTFSITEDQFGVGNNRALVNHKKYYYAVVAYAHNNYQNFEQVSGIETGQRTPYLEGGRVEIKTVIPRPVVDQMLYTSYGDVLPITRLEGEGTGGNYLSISDETRDAMLEPDFDGQITYDLGKGPLNVTVFNPFEIQEGDYEVEFYDSNPNDAILDNDAKWILRNKDNNGNYQEIARSEHGLNEFNEAVFAQYGFSITIGQTAEPGDYVAAKENLNVLSPGESNGALGAEIRYKNAEQPWLTSLIDQETGVFNYIQTGRNEKDHALDPTQALSTMGDGYFVPFGLATGKLLYGTATPQGLPRTVTPAWTGRFAGTVLHDETLGLAYGNNPADPTWLHALPNVDIVLTPDKSKWSRCIVIETASEYITAETSALPNVLLDPGLKTETNSVVRPRQSFDTRYGLSVGKEDANNDGLPDPDNAVEPDSIYDTPSKKKANPLKGQPLRGMGWFPGYAVNVETGERLNIFFGENSAYSKALKESYTGRDMLWNPTDEFVRTDKTNGEVTDLLLGGHHWLYVTNTRYDECAFLHSRFNPDYTNIQTLKLINKKSAIPQVSWAGMLTLAPGYQLTSLANGLIPNETLISLRVQNAYGVKTNAGNGHPKYRFRVESGRERTELFGEHVANALDSVKLVPNPYFAFSEYENSNTSNVVKITNLPARCVVSIYSLEGRFIRQYKRDEQYVPYRQITPALEWDLKNAQGIPVASGVYIVHVNAFDMGERTLKWFGVTRMFDPRGL